jgi:membrane protease YdiL (CAAX protease family)
MFRNSSKRTDKDVDKAVTDEPAPKPEPKERHWWMLVVIPVWVVVAFFLCQAIIGLIVYNINLSNPELLAGVSQVVLLTVVSAIVYVSTLVLIVGLPWWVRRNKTTRKELGVTGLPTWVDIVLTPAGFIVYLILSFLILIAAQGLLPWFDATQEQQLGFESLHFQYEYILAFLMLVVVAPIAEELMFRGYLFGKLRSAVPVWLAVVVTSVIFGFVHQAWNVGFDTFALSIVLCYLREITGTLWAPILLHMTKNGIAFYLLFISPVF